MSNDVSMYTINTTTGALSSSGTPVAEGTEPRSVTVDPSGRFAYVANDLSNNVSMYAINATTGALTPTTPATVTTELNPVWVTVDPSVRFTYVANFEMNHISMYTINASTERLTSIASPIEARTNSLSVTI